MSAATFRADVAEDGWFPIPGRGGLFPRGDAVPRVCTVCAHPDRAAIDEALVANRGTKSGIARERGLSEDALERHAGRHLPGALVKAHGAREATRADDLLGMLREAANDAQRLRVKAERERDYRCAVAAVKTRCDVIEKLADIGERLAKSGGPEEPRTLAEVMTRIARGEQARGVEGAVRVEWVNDWRVPGLKGPYAPEPQAPSADAADEVEPAPARLVS